MKRRFSFSIVLFFVVAAMAALFGSGCSKDGQYNGPTVSTVGVGGSYTDQEGETYGGTVNLGLAYPSPTPKPVDRSK